MPPSLVVKNAEYIRSISHLRDRPQPELPEFAFVGRSNVGKSSLINSLLGRKNLARISSKPGKTRMINYFLINEIFYLVDLPGYGFAKVNLEAKLEWQKSIERYLTNNHKLACLFLLMDARHGIKANDYEMLEWLEHHEMVYRIVFTKFDKVKQKDFMANIRASENRYGVALHNQFFPYSSVTGKGKEKILDEIASFL